MPRNSGWIGGSPPDNWRMSINPLRSNTDPTRVQNSSTVNASISSGGVKGLSA